MAKKTPLNMTIRDVFDGKTIGNTITRPTVYAGYVYPWNDHLFGIDRRAGCYDSEMWLQRNCPSGRKYLVQINDSPVLSLFDISDATAII